MTGVALFDLDDTLIDRTDGFLRWWRGFAAERGIDVDRIHDIADIGGGDYLLQRPLFEQIVLHCGLRENPYRVYLDFLADYPRHVRVAAPTFRALRRLRDADYRVGVVTNGRTHDQVRKIHLTGLVEYVDAWVVSQAVGANKPETRIFDAAADALGVELSPTAWMVGDNLGADIAGGAAAGLTTAWIRLGRTLRESDPTPDHIVDSPAEAVDLMLDR